MGLSILVGEGIWPYKRWSAPKRFVSITKKRFLGYFESTWLKIDGHAGSPAVGDIFCPAASVDALFLPHFRDQISDRPAVRVGDVLKEDGPAFLVDALYINRFGYVYATLRDQDSGQTISRTLN